MASLSRWRIRVPLGITLAALTVPAFGQPASGPRWVLQTDVMGGYQSNVSYYALQPQGDFATRLAARLGYRFEHQRAHFRLSVGAGTNLYAELSDYNQFTWDAGLDTSWSLSRRTVAEARARTLFGYGYGYVDTLEDIAIPPDTLRHNDVFEAALRHRFSRSVEGRLELDGNYYFFDSSEPLYWDGWSVTARAGLERSRSADSAVAGFAEYERASTFEQRFEIERVVVDWRKPVGRHIAVVLGGGLARYRLVDPLPGDVEGEPALEPTGSGEVVGRFGDHSLTVGAARQVGQVFGLGYVGVSRSLALGYRVALGSRLELNANVAAVEFLEGAGSAPLTARREQARAGISYAFGRALTARVDYVYWSGDEGTTLPGRHTIWAGVQHKFTRR